MKTPLACLVALLLVIWSPITAAQVDGSALLATCSAAVKELDGEKISQQEALGSLYCVAYVSGFLDATSLAAKFTAGRRSICMPDNGITNGQAARILVKYLRENPQTLHESGRLSLYIALAKAFPCAN